MFFSISFSFCRFCLRVYISLILGTNYWGRVSSRMTCYHGYGAALPLFVIEAHCGARNMVHDDRCLFILIKKKPSLRRVQKQQGSSEASFRLLSVPWFKYERHFYHNMKSCYMYFEQCVKSVYCRVSMHWMTWETDIWPSSASTTWHLALENHRLLML